jgi:hypothetical protein
VDYIYAEDELNQALGISTATAVLDTEYVPIPSSLTDFTQTPGADFDTELLTLATAEFSSASSDFLGDLSVLPGNLTGLF